MNWETTFFPVEINNKNPIIIGAVSSEYITVSCYNYAVYNLNTQLLKFCFCENRGHLRGLKNFSPLPLVSITSAEMLLLSTQFLVISRIVFAVPGSSASTG